MSKVKRTLSGNPHFLVLLVILLIGVFFRTYDLVGRFEYAHDGDLYSWIVKDILVNKHWRLIGQLTTAPGIFIGPLFYYMLIPFYLLTEMDPIGATIPIIAIGVATIFSYYWVLSRVFNITVGLIAAFLYAVLLSNVFFDLRVVPSTPTNLWLVWYFYSVMMILRGNFKVFLLLGLLVGLVWHIHIALLPVLAVIPAALVLSGKRPVIRDVTMFAVGAFIPSAPLFLFEARHGFLQTRSLFENFGRDFGGGVGLEKFKLVTIYIRGVLIRQFLYPQSLPYINHVLFFFFSLLPFLFLLKKKLIEGKALIIFYFWIGVIVLYYSFSSTVISEYYFANIEILYLAAAALLFYLLYKSSRLGKVLVVTIFALVFVKNATHYINVDRSQRGYIERKSAAHFIAQDSKDKGYPCIAVSYISDIGENVGFRQFFWLNDLHVNQPSSGSPTYTIVLPVNKAPDNVAAKFGEVGVILPENVSSDDEINESCSGENANLTDPLFGYTQ